MLRCIVCILALFATMAHAQEGKSQQDTGKAIVLTTAYGTHFDAYITGPASASRAVLLLHDRYGLDEQARDWADRFAGLGYLALAIDLYDGRHAKHWEHATSVMKSNAQEWADSDIAGALSYLKHDDPQRKVAILGWDYGGTEALLATLRDPTAVAATVSYYPAHLDTRPTVAQTVESPMLLVLAKRDPELNARPKNQAKSRLGKIGVNFMVQGLDALANLREIASVLRSRTDINVVGLDADREFSDPLSDHYDAAATASAWNVTKEFLASHMTP